MRESLNNNPVVQIAVIAVLLIGAGFFVLSTMGGGESESEGSEAAVNVNEPGSGSEAPPPGETESLGAVPSGGAVAVPPIPPSAAFVPPAPRAVVEAFDANRTVVLLFVRDRGIEDRLVLPAVERLDGMSGVSTFVVPVSKIARYASITQGVALERVPALIVVRPKNLDNGIPVASVSYGFQSPQSVVQAVIDARYRGRTLDYHP
jgi:hypothetical protein